MRLLLRASFVILQVLFIAKCGFCANETLKRQKRYVIYPKGGTFKIVIGIGIPVKLGSKQSMACGWNFQFQYGVPTNITQLEEYPPIISRARQKRSYISSDRALAYLGIEAIMNRHNLDGKSCMLRSICENAMHPLQEEANGLYGHLLHILLTPTYGDGKVDPELDPIYLEAQRAGEFGVDCLSLYPTCHSGFGMLEMISLLDY